MLSSLALNLRAGWRLCLLRRVGPEEVVATGEAFAVLVLLNLALLFVAAFAEVGWRGQVSYTELPRALLAVPLLLGFGLVAARVTGDRRAVLTLAVALMAAAAMINFALGLIGTAFTRLALPQEYRQYVFYFCVGWWTATIAGAVFGLMGGALRRKSIAAAAGIALLVLPAWWLPQGPLWVPADEEGREAASAWALAEEKGFYSQLDVLPAALAALEPGRPGIPDLYLVAAGFYAREDVFMKEMLLVATLFRERFDAEGRTLVLINNPATVDIYPLASLTSLAAGLKRVGELMDRDEDVLVLYLSSHGSRTHQLAVDFWPLQLTPIDPPALRKALDESGIKWKVVIVSACYSGGFVDALKDDFTAVITASSATRQSFGCGSGSDATWLGKALFDEGLRHTYSLEKAFDEARKSIETRERIQGHEPSEPQMHMGEALRARLAEIERRLAARAPGAGGGALRQ